MTTLLIPRPAPVQPITDATRREFLAALAAAGLLTGCSAEPAAPPAPSTRTVGHALGTSEIPIAPQRLVAASGTTELEALLALDVPLLAAAGDDDDFGGTAWLPHLAPLLDGVQMLPSRRNINVERIAAVQPDAIVGLAAQIEEFYPQLGAIAPTVGFDSELDWQALTRAVGDALGRGPEAAAVVAAFDDRVAALADRHRDRLDGVTVSLVKSFVADGQIDVSSGADVALPILSEMGFVRPAEQQEAADSDTARISLEQTGLVDTDVILIFRYDTDTEQQAADALRAQPLFARLPAVAAGRVYEVLSPWWHLGGHRPRRRDPTHQHTARRGRGSGEGAADRGAGLLPGHRARPRRPARRPQRLPGALEGRRRDLREPAGRRWGSRPG